MGKGVLRRALPRQQQRTVQAHAGGLSGISGVLFLLQRGALCPQPHQVVIRKAEHRPQHGRSQIDILRRVVDDLQQRDERPDVGCFHQVFPGVGIHRDATGRESFHIGREVPAGRKQDAAVLVLHRAGRAALPHRLSGGRQFFDAPGDPCCVRFGFIVRQKLCFHAAGVVPRCAAHQPLPIAVSGIAQLRGHELLKNEVDALHHLRGRTEIRIQRQQGVLPGSTLRRARAGRPAGQGRPAVQLFPEDAGVGLPEAVDALLQVAHQKEVIPRRGGKAAVQGILQRIGVLIFVHHHGSIVLPDAPAQRGGGAVRAAQQPQGKVFKVAEFQQLALPLFGREPGVEIPHRRKQGLQPGQCRLPVGFRFFLAAGDKLGDLSKQVGGLVSTGLDGRLVVALQPFFHALQAGLLFHAQHKRGEPVIQGRPLPCLCQPLHLAQQGGRAFQTALRVGVFFGHRCFRFPDGRRGLFFSGLRHFLGIVLPAVLPGGAQQLAGRLCIAGCLRQQQVMPAGGVKAVFLLPWSQKFVQLAVVVRQCPQEIIHLQDGVPRRFVGAALAVQVGKGAEIRVRVGVLQRFGQCRRAQQLHAAGVCRGKIRRDIQRLKMLVQQVQTERIHGADGCTLQQHALAAQGGVARLLLAAAQQRLPDAGPQLRRCRIRKGDDEQPVGVHRVLRVGDEAHSALGQHRRLAAAGRRTHQQRPAPVVDGGTLGRRPSGFAHVGSSSSSAAASGSKGFAGASRPRSPMPVSWQQIKS